MRRAHPARSTPSGWLTDMPALADTFVPIHPPRFPGEGREAGLAGPAKRMRRLQRPTKSPLPARPFSVSEPT